MGLFWLRLEFTIARLLVSPVLLLRNWVDFSSLSLHVARKQIWAVEGLLAAMVRTPIGRLWVVVQFVTSPVLGAGEDLDCELRVSF